MHCHVEFHNEMGMALVLKEGDVTDMTSPPRGMPNCGNADWSREEFQAWFKQPPGTLHLILVVSSLDYTLNFVTRVHMQPNSMH